MLSAAKHLIAPDKFRSLAPESFTFNTRARYALQTRRFSKIKGMRPTDLEVHAFSSAQRGAVGSLTSQP